MYWYSGNNEVKKINAQSHEEIETYLYVARPSAIIKRIVYSSTLNTIICLSSPENGQSSHINLFGVESEKLLKTIEAGEIISNLGLIKIRKNL